MDIGFDILARRLAVGPSRVHFFSAAAINQVAVLAAFEEEGWPDWVFDPMRGRLGIVPGRRVRETVASLNRTLRDWPIVFAARSSSSIITFSWVYDGDSGEFRLQP